ncbi:tubulin-specific chaperone E-like [Argiope bruennichi]|uniref:tubulin-specific chaperone E-like n=1 Tax=Argiope bruennichi TaxID=94029 RepID=UPI00249544D2|nr:tubulin-specific chaperone E-like [Argiope bruennichi]XP_055949978.1 tubulin-specific chaperone E-like [Argiope bruennichi]
MGASTVEIGCRIHCDGEYGTVLYIGPISGMDGTWLGIEWDNPSRGKHSGSYKDVTYFTTRVPNAGSFIKISKADNGISCPAAIRIKYGKADDSTVIPKLINLPQKSGQERHIEMVGMAKIMGKQSNFSQLTDIVLTGMLVNGPGKENELKELVPNVRDLDLSQNLFSTWDAVNGIVKQLPYLSILVLSKNRLRIFEGEETIREIYKSLKMLVLNDVAYCWKEILSCAVLWPFIEQLCVLDNGITTLEAPTFPIFSKLKLLSLDNNPLKNWSEVNKLGDLMNLEEIHLDNTSLESIEFPDASPIEKTNFFPSLKVLSIKNNRFERWQDIGELNKLKSLRNLMVNNNPIILSVNPETARQLIIAKIQGLEILNRTQIERSEKRGAELDYLKRYRNEWVTNYGNGTQNKLSDSFMTEHPTYIMLLQKHGAADENEVKEQSALIKDNLICVKIFSPNMPDKPMLIKKLPAEMTVGKLKALVKRMFKVAAQEVTLTRLFKEDESQKTEMDNNLRQLSFYSISDQDKIAVEW